MVEAPVGGHDLLPHGHSIRRAERVLHVDTGIRREVVAVNGDAQADETRPDTDEGHHAGRVQRDARLTRSSLNGGRCGRTQRPDHGQHEGDAENRGPPAEHAYCSKPEK